MGSMSNCWSKSRGSVPVCICFCTQADALLHSWPVSSDNSDNPDKSERLDTVDDISSFSSPVSRGQPVSSLVESVLDVVDDKCVESGVLDIDFAPSLMSVKPLSPPRGSK